MNCEMLAIYGRLLEICSFDLLLKLFIVILAE